LVYAVSGSYIKPRDRRVFAHLGVASLCSTVTVMLTYDVGINRSSIPSIQRLTPDRHR
jgi:hypothetical protein